MAPSDATSAPDPDGAARPRGAKHSVTARTKARRRAVEILFEADQRGLLRADRGEAPGRDERPAYDAPGERPARSEYDEYPARGGDSGHTHRLVAHPGRRQHRDRHLPASAPVSHRLATSKHWKEN